MIEEMILTSFLISLLSSLLPSLLSPLLSSVLSTHPYSPIISIYFFIDHSTYHNNFIFQFILHLPFIHLPFHIHLPITLHISPNQLLQNGCEKPIYFIFLMQTLLVQFESSSYPNQIPHTPNVRCCHPKSMGYLGHPQTTTPLEW